VADFAFFNDEGLPTNYLTDFDSSKTSRTLAEECFVRLGCGDRFRPQHSPRDSARLDESDGTRIHQPY